ncbi:MAG TPA: FapA family protein [bacterium]|nr:FapA family protein [bacterium]
MKNMDNSNREDEILKSLEEFDREQIKYHEDASPVVVNISKDKLRASVKVNPDPESETYLSEDDVKKALAGAGVVFGIDENELTEIFRYGSFGYFVPVAHGKPPTAGKDAEIDFKFKVKREKYIDFEEDEKGKVNFHELDFVQSVERDMPVAVKIPAGKGEPGMDVFGDEIPAREGRDIVLETGENTELSGDGLTVISKISGQPILRDDKLFVKPVFEVAGNVDFAIGNIDFDGSVLIHGSVLSDFVVRAVDDVQIKGNIEKAVVQAGGNVIVNGGLYGLNEGRISAGDSVIIRSVESGNIEAKRNITILQASRHSSLMAGEDIILNNPKGSILGGRLICGKTCDVSELGSTSFTQTIVELGLGPKTIKIRKELEAEIAEIEANKEKIRLNLNTLRNRKNEGTLSGDDEELMKKLVPAFHQLNAAIDEKRQRLNFLMDKIGSMEPGRCRIRGKAHPGVKILTPNASYVIRDESYHCSFYENNDQIVLGPY